MKTISDYMKDPDIIHEPMAMREIHAIRLKHYEDRRNMSSTEYNALVHKNAQAFLAEPIYAAETDLTAAGKA
jgi:hypothetical protein